MYGRPGVVPGILAKASKSARAKPYATALAPMEASSEMKHRAPSYGESPH